jgi:hypothetical protein
MLMKKNLLGTHFNVKDGEGKDVAEWTTLILSLHMGRTTLKFLEQEGETVVNLVMEPTGFGRRAEESLMCCGTPCSCNELVHSLPCEGEAARGRLSR